MKTFKLPQQAETTVNNVKKTGELFKKYNLATISAPYAAEPTLIAKLEYFADPLTPIPNKYNGKDVGIVYFLDEFQAHLEPKTKDLVLKIVTKWKQNKQLKKEYRLDQNLNNNSTYVDLKKQENSSDPEKTDTGQDFEWEKEMEKLVKVYFLVQNLPQVPTTVPNSPKVSNNNTQPPVVQKKPKVDTTTVVTTVSPAPIVSIWNTEFLDKVERVVQGGLGYFDTFLNGLASFLGDKKSYFYYKYEAKVIDKNVSSMEEFVRKNSHLGRNFFTEVMPLLMTEELTNKERTTRDREIQLIGDDNIFPVAQVPGYIEDEEFILTLVNRDFVRGPSPEQGVDHDYIYGILDEATFTAVCEPAVMGAILTAKAQINRIPGKENFTLKELMMSPGVFDMFQQRVSFVFLSGSGGYAYAGKSSSTQFGKVNGTTFNVSVGLKQREALAANMECSGYWFQDVYRVQNPRIKELEEFVAKCGAELKRILANLNVSLNRNREIRGGARNLTDQNPQDPSQLYPPYAFNNLNVEEKLIFLDEFCIGVKISLLSKLASIAGKLTVRNVDIELKDGTQKLFVKTAFRLRLAQNQLLHVPNFVLVHYE